MPDIECESGNTTTYQTPQVLRQVSYELRRRDYLHPDVVIELRKQREDWLASERGKTVHGFLHAIGDTPFYLSFDLEKQIELFVQICKADNGGVIHFDATGRVIENIPNQKMALYYS